MLEKLAHHLELKLSLANKTTQTKEKQMQFVKAGRKSNVGNLSRQTGLLVRASDWEMSVDLRTRLQFPFEIMTSLKSDLSIFSKSKKSCIIIVELTVPYETRMEEAFERKKSKYSDLYSMCEESRWKAWCFPVEIGSIGVVGRSTIRALGEIGITGKERNTILEEITEAADKASTWLWIKRGQQQWS